MLSHKTKGIILRKINYGDNDVIFEILSEGGQLISFIAKGARKIKSKYSGVLQLGLVINISYTKGKSLSYPTEITLDTECLTSFYSRSLSHMNFYIDVVTITRAIAKDLEEPELFAIAVRIFQKVEAGDDLLTQYNEFLSQVLSLISAETELRCAMSGDTINEPEFYYSAEINKVFSKEHKPTSIKLENTQFTDSFYCTYLQRLLLEHVHSKIRLKFKPI